MKEIKKSELVDAEKQKIIINKIIQNLFLEDTSLYYASTIDIAMIIKMKIETPAYLNNADKELVAGLTARDIQNLISYASNCC
jgi:hypothetical protein